jgi:hypothetical protein
MVGCSVFILLSGLLLFAVAWFGPPLGIGHWRGLRVTLSSDLVYTMGTVIRFDEAGPSRQRMPVPVVEFLARSHWDGLQRRDETAHASARFQIREAPCLSC